MSNPMVDPPPGAHTIELERSVLQARVAELEAAIRTHRTQKADDRCIEDDDRLYAALGDGVPCDRRVGCQLEMVKNCVRFIQNRTEGGGWPTYAQLEGQLANARAAVASLEGVISAGRAENERQRRQIVELEADRDSHRAAADELRAAVDTAVRAVPLQFWVAERDGRQLAKAEALPLSTARLAEAATTYRQAAATLQTQCDTLTADVERLNNLILELRGV